MKLLTKQAVNIQSAEIKRQQISEGQDLVKRIEALRAAHSSLQEQHKNFVNKSKEELNRETTELYGQRETLKSEVESLTVVKAELQKPLDEEWRRVRQESTTIATEKERFLLEQLSFERKQSEFGLEKSRLDNRAEKLSQLESAVNERERKSIIVSEESEKIIQEVRKNQQKAETQIAKRLKEVLRKEKAVDFEKQGVEQVKKLNKLKEYELADLERQLIDRQQTLERTIKRNGK